MREPMVCCGIAGIQRNGLLELRFGGGVVPIIGKVYECQGVVCFCKAVVQLYCPTRRHFSSRHRFQRGKTTMMCKYQIGVSHPGIRCCVTRIQLDSLLEKLQSFELAFASPLVP